MGIADGEYIETDELVSNGNDIDFESSAIKDAITFASEFNWDAHPQFDEATKKRHMIFDGNV